MKIRNVIESESFEKVVQRSRILSIMNRTLITILVGVIVLAGVLVFVSQKKPSQVTPIDQVSTEVIFEAPDEQTSVPENFVDQNDSKIIKIKDLAIQPPKGWQTYRNEDLGFEIQYPEGWFVKEYSDDQIVSFGPGWSRPGGGLWHVNIGMSENLEDEVEKFISNQNEYHTVDRNSIKNIEIDGYSAIILESRTETPDHYRPQTKIFFIKNGKLFRILENEDATTTDNPDHDNGETFKMFYESFRFIN